MSTGRTPKAYVNDVMQDNNTMKYVNEGDFAELEIGGRPSGKPKQAGSKGMGLDHVGGSQGNKG